jgi:hypothetical protein
LTILSKFPDAIAWTCHCGATNTMKNGVCKKCKSPLPGAATSFRLRNMLTPDEENFYKSQVPVLIGEFRLTNQLLKELIDVIKDSGKATWDF